MQKGDVIRARFMTLPDLFPGKGCEEKKFPIRKGTVVYVHPKGRYIVAECGGVEHFVGNRDALQETGVCGYAVEGQCRRVTRSGRGL